MSVTTARNGKNLKLFFFVYGHSNEHVADATPQCKKPKNPIWMQEKWLASYYFFKATPYAASPLSDSACLLSVVVVVVCICK